jgi:hypothetical protein
MKTVFRQGRLALFMSWVWLVVCGGNLPGQIFTDSGAVHGVEWRNLVKAAQFEGRLGMGTGIVRTDPTSVPAAWDAGGVGKRIMYGDGAVTFRFSDPSKRAALGLAATDPARNPAAMAYAIRCVPGPAPTFEIREGNAVRRLAPGASNELDAFTVFRVSRKGGMIRWQKDGREVYASPIACQDPLVVAVGLLDGGAALAEVSYEGAGVPEDVLWARPLGALASYLTGGSGTRISKSGASALYDAGAVGHKAIAADGVFLFRFGQVNAEMVAGMRPVLSVEGLQSYAPADFSYGIRCRKDGRFEVVESGVSCWVSPSALRATDLFCIERSGGSIHYRRNDEPFYSSQVPSSDPLAVGVGMLTSGGALTYCQCLGGVFSEPVSWANMAGLNNSYSPGGSGLWVNPGASNGEARSAKPILSDGWIDFRFGAPGQSGVTGFALDTGSTGASPILHGVQVRPDGQWEIVEAGAGTGPRGSFSEGDRFRIRRWAGRVEWLKNESLIRVASDEGRPLRGLAVLKTPGAKLLECQYAGVADDVVWRGANGAAPGLGGGAPGSPGFGGLLVRGNGAAGWMPGASSSRQMPGDGSVAFRFATPNKRAMLGLSRGESHRNADGWDMAIYGRAGSVRIYVRGEEQRNAISGTSGFGTSSFGGYTAADIFRILRSDGSVSFWRNAELLHRVYSGEWDPCVVDCALYDPGAAIADCQMEWRDSDGDGLEDSWEMAHFGHLHRKGRDDYDYDGSTERQEFVWGTDPLEAAMDSDADGLPDQWEKDWFGGLSTASGDDPDFDGIPNLREYQYGSDPRDRFNGEVPQIAAVSGDAQAAPLGELLPAPLAAELRDGAGRLLINAPVQFSVTSGGGHLYADAGGISGGAVTSLEVRTGPDGCARVWFRMPGFGAPTHQVRAGVWSRSGGFGFTQFEAFQGEEFDLSSARLWLRADEGLELAGNQVLRWHDQSGAGNDATLFDGASEKSRPVSARVGSIQVVRFDGLDDRMTLPAELGRDSFTIVAAVASAAKVSARVPGVAYGARNGGATGQSYLLGGPRPEGESPWPAMPPRPNKLRFSTWVNRTYADEPPVGRIYYPLAFCEESIPVPEGYAPVARRYDVTAMSFYDPARNEYVRNPRGAWTAERCGADLLKEHLHFGGWNVSQTRKTSVSYRGGLVDSVETFYELSAAAWKGLSDATYPAVSVLSDVSAGISSGSNGVSAFDLRSDYHPVTARAERASDPGFRIVTVRYDSRRPKIYDNGVLKSEGARSLAGTVHGPQYLGSSGCEGNYFKGSIAELMVFERALSEEERETVENYLAERVGLNGLDRDRDSLPDYFEYRWFGDLDEIATGDPDGDGLSNSQECIRGLNPRHVDTDQDGLRDDYEIFVSHTDPAMADSDGDGYPDGYEVEKGWSPLNPENALVDADGNGIHDGWDFALKYNPFTADSDQDGLRDHQEFRIGSNPFGLADSNADGISDRIAWFSGVSAFLLDQDGDGLSNSEELIRGTDPFSSDTDGDGERDGSDPFPLDPIRSTLLPGNAADKTPPEVAVIRPPDARRVRSSVLGSTLSASAPVKK